MDNFQQETVLIAAWAAGGARSRRVDRGAQAVQYHEASRKKTGRSLQELGSHRRRLSVGFCSYGQSIVMQSSEVGSIHNRLRICALRESLTSWTFHNNVILETGLWPF